MNASTKIKPIFTPVQSISILTFLFAIGIGGFLAWRSHRSEITRQTVLAFEAKNWNEGVRLSIQADRSVPTIQAGLGLCYMLGLGGVMEDHQTGFAWYMKAALQGDKRGQSSLGQCYYQGKGVEKNYSMAAKWFRKAAEQGWSSAQCTLGDCLYDGKGVNKNVREAVEWWQKSAEQSFADAQYRLGRSYLGGDGVVKNASLGLQYMIKAAENNCVDAQRDLGRCYYRGCLGVNKNRREAEKWLKKAIEQGDSTAKSELAQMEDDVRQENMLRVKQQKEAEYQKKMDAIGDAVERAAKNMETQRVIGHNVVQGNTSDRAIQKQHFVKCRQCDGRGFYMNTRKCSDCKGKGYYEYQGVCPKCNASGEVVVGRSLKPCRNCNGSGGVVKKNKCRQCGGTGSVQRQSRCSQCEGHGKVKQ